MGTRRLTEKAGLAVNSDVGGEAENRRVFGRSGGAVFLSVSGWSGPSFAFRSASVSSWSLTASAYKVDEDAAQDDPPAMKR